MEPRRPYVADALAVAALLVLAGVFWLLGCGLLDQWHRSVDRGQEPTVEAVLGLTAAACGAGLLLWWTIALACATASVLLEQNGRRRAAAAARALSPVFMQRVAIAALSLQLASGVPAHAAASPVEPEWTPTPAQSSSAPYHPVGAAAAQQSRVDSLPEPEPGSGPLQRVNGGASATSTDDAGGQPAAATLSPGWQPLALPVEPGLLAGAATRPAAGSESGTETARGTARVTAAVTVLAGDTLWDIAAAHLGPEASDVQIALEWPRWYAANRALIGTSPDVLLPGQILQAPAPS